MLVTLLAAAATATLLVLGWRVIAGVRHPRSLESLQALLSPGWNARELIDCDDPLGLNSDPKHLSLAAKWKRIRNARCLWALYRNAGLMLEVADYAAHSNGNVDQQILSVLRDDAMHIRMHVLETVLKYACAAATESIYLSALRAEAMYAEMATCLSDFLRAAATDSFPGFAAAD